MTRVLVIMGVSGSGKSTLATRLADSLCCAPVLEADLFHPPENREKMRSGIPLTDEDRWPWLARINLEMKQRTGECLVVACSALKAAYRERLIDGMSGRVHFILLDASREVLERHHRGRVHEYMPASLLDSQLKTLERPGPHESASVVSVAGDEQESFFELLSVVRTLGISG